VSTLKPLLNNDYDLYGVVKPGSGTSELSESAKEVAGQLTHDDVMVICSGTNDYDMNDFSKTFRNNKDHIVRNNHTDILLTNAPIWYDLPNSFAVNEKI
jgi:cytochrome b involved in lipid metabolism